MSLKLLHKKAIECAKRYLKAEAELLDVLQKIDDKKVFREMGYASLFSYTVEVLRLSESQAYSFIGVARKAKEETKESSRLGRRPDGLIPLFLLFLFGCVKGRCQS